MRWYESCTISSLVTHAYDRVPDLDPVDIYLIDLDPGIPSLGIGAFMPELPDDLNLPEGEVADKAEVYLYFAEISELSFSGTPCAAGGRLEIQKLDDACTEFSYTSPTFVFSGKCVEATVGQFGILSKSDGSYPEPQGRSLFSHRNVWNTCLLLLNEYEYDIHVTGHWTRRDYPARLRWHATNQSGVMLSANTPIELLGLAALHRHHEPIKNGPYWWKIDGPSKLSEIIQKWGKPVRASRH